MIRVSEKSAPFLTALGTGRTHSRGLLRIPNTHERVLETHDASPARDERMSKRRELYSREMEGKTRVSRSDSEAPCPAGTWT